MTGLPTGIVTFLFTDIEGSTRLLERLGDDYVEVLDRHRALVSDAVRRSGGSVFGSEGDALFCAFPTPGGALEAAVDSQRALAEETWPHGATVRVRMGVHSGEARVVADDYVGLSLHHAARVASSAQGGQIVVSDITRQLAGARLPSGVELRDLGHHRLKDITEPLRLFQASHVELPADFPPLRSLIDVPDGPHAAASGFVGRETESRRLMQILEGAFQGRGQTVLVAGEPGIGKSRFLEQIASRSRERGARVLTGRCWEAGGAPSYWPWIQSMRSYVRSVEADALHQQVAGGAVDIAQLLPELSEIMPGPPPIQGGDPEGARFRLFDSAATFLSNASVAQPLVFVLDDLHAADTPSLLLLEFLADLIPASRMLVVGAYRDGELGPAHPLSETLARLARTSGVQRIRLGGWSPGEVVAFVESAVGHRPPDGIIRMLLAGTEGNPLFVAEVLRLLISEGRSLEDGDSWVAAISRGVKDVVGQRLDTLPAECREVLTLASVFGREFSIDALSEATATSVERILDSLDSALEAGLVVETPESLSTLRFSHLLVRDALYDQLTPAGRVRMHRTAGTTLEIIYLGDEEPHLSELAHHFLLASRGGDSGKAVEYARRAAERATQKLGFEEAARLYRMALAAHEFQRKPDELGRCDLILALGDALARGGDIAAAKEAFQEGAEIAREIGRPQELARAALGYGGRFVWEAARGDANLVPLLEESLRALGDEESILRVRVLARLAGGPLRDEVDRGPRDVLSREAVEMARRLGDLPTLSYALDGRYAAIWGPDDLDERITVATQLIEAATEIEDKERALQGYHYRCLAELERGDAPAARRDAEAQTRLAEELRQPVQRWYETAVRATLANFEGRFAEAERLIDDAFTLGQPSLGGHAEVLRAVQLWSLRREQDRLDEVDALLGEVARDFSTYRVLGCIQAHGFADREMQAEARQQFGELAADDFTALPRNDEWLFGMTLLGDVAVFVQDTARGEALYEHLLPYRNRCAVSAPDACLGSTERTLGLLASLLDRGPAAEEHFEHALKTNAEMGSRVWLSHTQHDYAAFLLGRGSTNDREYASDLLAAARDASRDIGMSLLQRRIDQLR